MNDFKAMGSIADKMLCIVNTTKEHDFNYEIAVSLLKNYDKIKNMTISEIADMCYVSKASISRFCRFLGYEDFKEFHSCLQSDYTMNSDYSRQFYRMLRLDQKNAVMLYKDELISNMNNTVSDENLLKITEIVSKLNKSTKISFFSHHFLWDIGKYFQSKMMLMGKYIDNFFHYEDQLDNAKKLTEDDFVIVCSVGGSYPSLYPEIWKSIISSKCEVLFITQNTSSPYLNQVNHVLQCGISNQNDLGKYSALMIIDLIIIEFMKRYDQKSF